MKDIHKNYLLLKNLLDHFSEGIIIIDQNQTTNFTNTKYDKFIDKNVTESSDRLKHLNMMIENSTI